MRPAGSVTRAARVWLCLLATAGLAGCSSAVQVTAAPEAGSAACRDVAAHWPGTVAGHERRDTTSGSASVRAWGDPAVIARCGMAPPGPTTDTCLAVDGVDWVAHRLSDGVRFTTYGRSPAVEVLVPHEYAPEPLLLPAFTSAAEAIPQGTHRCR